MIKNLTALAIVIYRRMMKATRHRYTAATAIFDGCVERTLTSCAARGQFPRRPGVPISPILRWDVSNGQVEPFEDWIDWDWDSWLDCQYESTKSSITEDMISRWTAVKIRRRRASVRKR